jgi:hypothetical protein
VVIKSINFNAHTFPGQFNIYKGGFDNQLPNGESNVVSQITYFDLNSGVIISRRFGNIEPEAGYTFFHINQPNESFVNQSKNDKLQMRQGGNLGLNFYIGQKVILRAYSLYGYTSRVSDWVSGINYEYILTHAPFYTNSVFAGFMWRSGVQRNPDAGIVTAGLNYKNWTLGFSYDITFSQLKTSVESKGAYEIALIIKGKSSRIHQKTVPCERY